MSGRRRMGRIRTHPARQRRIARKLTSAQREHGRPAPSTLATLAVVPKLPRSWLEAVWSDGAPFKAMKAQHRDERRERLRGRPS